MRSSSSGGLAFLSSYDPEERRASQKRVRDYLKVILDEREGGAGEDLLTRIANWRRNPRFQSDDECLSMASLLFFGGLDTVASELSFIAHHLATHPELQRRLREEPGISERAGEEFIRRFGLSNTGRIITRDFEYKGVQFKKDEMVLVPINISGIDDRLYPDPMTVDFDRDAPSHNTSATARIDAWLHPLLGPRFRFS